jgi:fatty-acyl-CoA synthase
VSFIDEYPMPITGKVQKFRLREIGIEELALQGAATIETA